MKTLVLLMLLAFPVSTFAQKTVKYPTGKHQIQPRSNDSLRIEIHRNERLDIDFKLTRGDFRVKLFTPFILAGVPTLLRNSKHPSPDSQRDLRAQSIQLGILGSLAIADYHEICNGVNQNPNNQKWFMDDYNNHEGFDIAIAANCNQQTILNAVWMAYNEGLLHDINGHPTTGN